ncbi:unnamed protein product, partial [marine sediment metagenome]
YMLGIGEWAALIENNPTDMALVKSASSSDNLMKQQQYWELIYRDYFIATILSVLFRVHPCTKLK